MNNFKSNHDYIIYFYLGDNPYCKDLKSEESEKSYSKYYGYYGNIKLICNNKYRISPLFIVGLVLIVLISISINIVINIKKNKKNKKQNSISEQV